MLYCRFGRHWMLPEDADDTRPRDCCKRESCQQTRAAYDERFDYRPEVLALVSGLERRMRVGVDREGR